MLDYAHDRIVEALKTPHRAVLATSGPAGVQASEVPCEGLGLTLYLLAPRTSDHLFNLELDGRVTLVAAEWELQGTARVVDPIPTDLALDLLAHPDAAWCALVRVDPDRLQVRRAGGWGHVETYDLTLTHP